MVGLSAGSAFDNPDRKELSTYVHVKVKEWYKERARNENVPCQDYVRNVLLAHYKEVTGEQV